MAAGSAPERAEALEAGSPLLGPRPFRRQVELAPSCTARHATRKVEEPPSDRLGDDLFRRCWSCPRLGVHVQGLQHLLLERTAARNEVDCARAGGDELAAHLAELGKGTGGCWEVRSGSMTPASGFSHSAQPASFGSAAWLRTPDPCASFQTSRRTSSSASVGQDTTWKLSVHIVAFA